MAQDVPAPPRESGSSILVPPRPNLGPEPLPEPAAGMSMMVYLAPAVVLAALAGWRYARRRRNSTKASEIRPESIVGSANDATVSPGARLLALADRARAGLFTRFGEPWRAKTTEEIAMDSRFSATFDTNSAAMFLDLLRLADVEKFSDHCEGGDQRDLTALLDSWEALLRDVFEAGARSTINGK